MGGNIQRTDDARSGRSSILMCRSYGANRSTYLGQRRISSDETAPEMSISHEK
jgi:hypothetical protein